VSNARAIRWIAGNINELKDKAEVREPRDSSLRGDARWSDAHKELISASFTRLSRATTGTKAAKGVAQVADITRPICAGWRMARTRRRGETVIAITDPDTEGKRQEVVGGTGIEPVAPPV
jgi:hypothetical protein